MELKPWMIVALAILLIGGVFMIGLLVGYLTSCDPCTCPETSLLSVPVVIS